MRNPLTFETAWQEAEQAAFNYLVAATGAIDNRSAFLGRNPGVINAWAMEHLPLTEEAASVLFARDQPTLAMQYNVEALFQKREHIQKFLMALVGKLPATHIEDTNIACLRVRTIGQMEYGEITIVNEQKPIGAWTLTATLDLVFVTGGEANMAT